IKTANDDVRLQALIDGKKIVINEASIMHDHKLNDVEGIYVNPSLTKKVFANMKTVGTGFSGRKHKPRRKERKETKVSPTKLNTEDHVPTTSNVPLPCGEDRMQLKELMDICTNLSNKVLDLENKVIEMKSSHIEKIAELGSRVEKLEEENMSLTKEHKSFNTRVESLAIKETIMDKEESSKQGRKIIDIDANAYVNLENVYNLDMAHKETVLSMQDVSDVNVKEVAKEMVKVIITAKIIVDEVSTAGGKLNAANKELDSAASINITTAQPSEVTKITVDITTPPKAKGIVFHDKEESTTRTDSLKSLAKDKGKSKLVKEPEIQKYKKAQIIIDEEVERRIESATRTASIKSLAKDKGKAKLVEEPEILKSRKAQITLNEEVARRIEAEWNADMKDNVDWNEDNAEKQKLEEQQEAKELKKNLEIVPADKDDVFVNVTPLSYKPPTIMDYKIYKEGKNEHFQLIRANERFKESQPKEVLDVFLWNTLKAHTSNIISGLDEVRYIREPIMDLYRSTSTSSPPSSFNKGFEVSIENDESAVQSENLMNLRVKVIRCDNGTEFKNREMNQFYEMKGIMRQYSVVRTPQENGVVERRNRTLIEAATTMLADSKMPTTFWAEAVNTACYV
nr:putative ribonuclease H-like domain-containing protein [Tanacetum cinerariifolium]